MRSCRLLWSRPEDSGSGDPFTTRIINFGIELSTTPDFLNPFFLSFSHDSTAGVPLVQMIFNYKLTNLPKGKVIYSRVYAVASAGVGAPLPSNGSFAIDVPSSPRKLTVDSGEAGASIYFRLNWTTPLDSGGGPESSVSLPLSYLVVLALSPDFLAPMEVSVSSTNTTLVTGTFLKQGLFYFICVSARNTVGLSLPSEVVQKQLVVPPSQPQQVQLNVSGPLIFNLSWRPPLDLGAGDIKTFETSFSNPLNCSGKGVLVTNENCMCLDNWSEKMLNLFEKQLSRPLLFQDMLGAKHMLRAWPMYADRKLRMCEWLGRTEM